MNRRCNVVDDQDDFRETGGETRFFVRRPEKPRLITGIHHVTAIAGDPQRNLDFWSEVTIGRIKGVAPPWRRSWGRAASAPGASQLGRSLRYRRLETGSHRSRSRPCISTGTERSIPQNTRLLSSEMGAAKSMGNDNRLLIL